MNTIPDITSFLADGSSYKGNFESVEIRETHISKVFLTDRFAYKLKKPVRFDFLDFSTLELRHAACEQEVQLKPSARARRLSGNHAIASRHERRIVH